MCQKRVYPDKKTVRTQINLFKKQRGRHGRAKALRSYWCEEHRGWHLTKQMEDTNES